MAVFQTRASLVQNAPASPMAPFCVASVQLATLVTGSHARILMNAKKFQMLAILLMESIAVSILSQVTTASPVLHVSLVLSPLEEELNKQLLKNRFGLLFICFGFG